MSEYLCKSGMSSNQAHIKARNNVHSTLIQRINVESTLFQRSVPDGKWQLASGISCRLLLANMHWFISEDCEKQLTDVLVSSLKIEPRRAVG